MFFGKTSWISASSFSSSIVICVKIFKHGPYFLPRKGCDLVSTSASFSFKQSQVKIWKGKVNIPVLKTKSTVSIQSPMWRWSLLKTGHWVWLGVAFIFLSLVFGKTLQMEKKLVKMIGCRHVCYQICRRNYSFSLRQNISNLCQSIFVLLTVYYDKIFKHWIESSSIRLRVSFFIAFVHK